jgi:hypothetical protein
MTTLKLSRIDAGAESTLWQGDAPLNPVFLRTGWETKFNANVEAAPPPVVVPPPPPPPLPVLSIADGSATEGNSASSPLSFTITLDKASATPVVVGYATSDMIAKAGEDYEHTVGTISFDPGETTKTVIVLVMGDTFVEPDETFKVTLVSPTGATIGRGSATGTIVGDDIAPAPVPTGAFATAIRAAWDADEPLDWVDGDVTLNAPIELVANSNKTGFSLNMNEANVHCAFNDPTKYAISFVINNGGVNIREFSVKEIKFRSVTPFAGGLRFTCRLNTSWIYSYTVSDISCGGHSEHAVWLDGSVFECDLNNLKSTNGKGLLRATTYVTSQGHALPSAMVGKNWRPRDFNGNAVQFDSPTPYAEPFDLRLTEGYFVTGLGNGIGISAPSGMTAVDGCGFENIRGKAAMYIGYRGARVTDCQGSNPSPNTNVATNPGMAYLVDCGLTGTLKLEGCSVENYGSGSGMKLAKVQDLQGGGRIVLDPSRSDANGDDIDSNFAKDRFQIAVYRNKT